MNKKQHSSKNDNAHKFSLFDKIFSFTDRVRRKHVQNFLWQDFWNIRWFIGLHPVSFLKQISFPCIWFILLISILFFYFIYLSPSIESLESSSFKNFAEYLMLWLFFFWIFLILATTKRIYDIYVDYRNDFIITMTDWIYKSDKNWIFHHAQTKITFDSIHTITSTEKHVVHSFFWTWLLYIKTTWDMEDIEFDHAKDINLQVEKLKDLHSAYLQKNDVKTALWEVMIEKKNPEN